ncbi:hypothetical protein CYANOKiyG1_72920 [Okeania sp. KiyG1]|nr:hypothetical protein CYANOKiyG1_72920 [Okeania sp. KiyG1]
MGIISCPVALFVYKIKVTIAENLLPPAFLPPKSNCLTGHDIIDEVGGKIVP